MPPPKPTTALTPITFADFTPGIADLPGVGYKPESATRANTYRCIANHAGALVPLPRRTVPFTMPHINPDPDGDVFVVGLFVPPIGLLPSPATYAFTPNEFPEHELLVGLEYSEAGTHAHQLLRYRAFDAASGPIPHDTLKALSWSEPTALYPPTGMSFAATRSNRANYKVAGSPVTICMWANGPDHGYVAEFPDDQNPSSNTPFDIFTNLFTLNMCTHQGRIVLELATVYNHGSNAITFMGENLMWSYYNDVTVAKWGTWNGSDPTLTASFDPNPRWQVMENPCGYAFLVSMTANELFAVKTGHGGMYVTGALDVGVVVSLPMVTGSEISHIPTITPIGVVYGNRRSGVWAWNHGDNSTLISQQMIPDFWVLSQGVDQDEFGGTAYSLSSMDDWVFTPNNFLYDTQLKSWWRLEDPAICQFRWTTSQWHFIYGAEEKYQGSSDTAIHRFKREDKADTYSWQSQPIWQSVADIVNVDQIELIAEGEGTVTLTLTALDGDTKSIVITLENRGFPERFREAFAIQGKYLQLRIESNAPNGFLVAPTVYSVTLYPFSEAPIGHTL